MGVQDRSVDRLNLTAQTVATKNGNGDDGHNTSTGNAMAATATATAAELYTNNRNT